MTPPHFSTGVYRGWLIDLRIEFSGFKIHFTTLKEELTGLKGTSKEHDKQLQQQEIKLREHDVRLDTQKKPAENAINSERLR